MLEARKISVLGKTFVIPSVTGSRQGKGTVEMWKDRLRNETGQIFVLFALTLPVLLGLAAVVVDVGNFYFQKRTLRGAVDAAALSAAQDLASRNCSSSTDACYGVLRNDGGTLSTTVGLYTGKNAGTATTASMSRCVTATDPNVSAAAVGATVGCFNWPYLGDWNRIEVKLKRKAPTAFAKIFGVQNVIVNGRAVAGLRPAAPPPYSFISLNATCQNHTLILQVGGRLEVTSGIYVNSCNDHDGFDIKGDQDTSKGEMTAPVIKTVGGWEVYHDDTVVSVGGLAECPIPPRKYFVGVNQSGGACPEMGVPILADPFEGKIPIPTRGDPSLGSGPTGVKCGGVVGSAGTPTVCIPPQDVATTLDPGTYYGGICIGTAAACGPARRCDAGSANTRVTLNPGTYIMAGGGFWVCGQSSLDAEDVMIYNTNSAANVMGGAGSINRIVVNTKGSVALRPQDAGMYKGLTIFQDPALAVGNNCGTDRDADIALLSLGPDVVEQTYGPYVDSGAKLAAKMLVGATQMTVDRKNKIKTGDRVKIVGDPQNQEFLAGAVSGGGKVIAVTPASLQEHAVKTKVLVSRLATKTGPGEHLDSVSGTIYAHDQWATFATKNVRGTANLAIITGCIYLEGSDTTFDFDAEGLFGLAPALTE